MTAIAPNTATKTKWKQDVYRLDPHHPGVVLFSSALYIPQANRNSIDRPNEIDNIDFIYPNNILYQHLHRRWQKSVYFPKRKNINNQWGEFYTFRFKTDDGMRLYLDNKLIAVSKLSNKSIHVDSWVEQDTTEYIKENVWISAGYHTLRVEHYNHTREGEAKFTITPDPEDLTDIVEPPPPPEPPPSLAGVLQILPGSISNLSYQKGSLISPEVQLITLRNRSDRYRIKVSMDSVSSLKFNPNTIYIDPMKEEKTWLTFDVAEMDKIQSGLNRITSIFTVEAVAREEVSEDNVPTDNRVVPVGDTEPLPERTKIVEITSGNNQIVPVGNIFSDLIVKVVNSNGNALPGETVTWSVVSGQYESFVVLTGTTGADGLSRAQLKSIITREETIIVKAEIDNNLYVLFTNKTFVPQPPFPESTGSTETTKEGGTRRTGLENFTTFTRNRLA